MSSTTSPIQSSALAASAGAGAATAAILASKRAAAAGEPDAIRPFSIRIPDEALADLRQRIVATRWPERETVEDQSQGIRLAKLKPLVEYWGTGYDWRTAEAKLNGLPQFITTIDGL